MYQKRRSVSNRSFSYESKQARIEHQIDEYAKKLQAQRRRINLYEEEKRQIQEEMKKRKKGIFEYNKSLESTKSKLAYTMTLNFKKKTDVFHKRNNQTIQRINALKSLINKLRFQKRTTKETVQRCEQQLMDLNRQLDLQKGELDSKNQLMNNAKDEIIGLKTKIEQQQSSFVHKFKHLKKEFEEQRIRNTKNEGKLKQPQKYNTSDTATMLRRKLQAIIVNNKQKIKMIESYQRNMRILDDAFTAMKQSSGLTDIKEIETVFIKSEQQNCQLLTYLNTLNQEIEKIEDENVELVQKCDTLEAENREREQLLNRVPEEEIKRELLQNIQNKKLDSVNQTAKLLLDLSPKVFECILKLKGNSENKDTNMHMINYQKMIKELEESVNKVVQAKSKKYGRNLLEDSEDLNGLSQKLQKKSSDLNNTYLLPNYDIQMENKNDLMDYESLRQIALEAINDPVDKEKQKPKERLSKRN